MRAVACQTGVGLCMLSGSAAFTALRMRLCAHFIVASTPRREDSFASAMLSRTRNIIILDHDDTPLLLPILSDLLTSNACVQFSKWTCGMESCTLCAHRHVHSAMQIMPNTLIILDLIILALRYALFLSYATFPSIQQHTSPTTSVLGAGLKRKCE